MQVGTGVFGQQYMYVILIGTFIYNAKNIVKKTWSFQALLFCTHPMNTQRNIIAVTRLPLLAGDNIPSIANTENNNKNT